MFVKKHLPFVEIKQTICQLSLLHPSFLHPSKVEGCAYG